MEANLPHIERIVAAVFGVVVFVTAVIALKNDWRSVGLENSVFKVMLGLLALGAALGFFAAIGVVGRA
ncbi:MAG: hypothetical protein M3Y21_03885 [Candidatus Eremiobacteraeota bacterium]|nr:hypothetical protein [Candidatus Eremiobacteraeota bacterium]